MASARACRMDVKEANAAVQFALGIIGADEGGAGDDRDDESEEGEPEVPAECERVTPSQIDTSVALSANTVEALFGSESEDSETPAELPLCATSPHIEDESSRASQIDTSIALSANTIDEIFCGAMSGDEPDVALSLCAGQNGAVVEPVTPTNSRRNDERTNSREDRGLLQEDVNIMKDEDNADEYESMDSESDGFGSEDDNINQITLRSMAWAPASSEYETDNSAFKDTKGHTSRKRRAKNVHVSFVKDAAYQVKRYGMFAAAYESNLITYRARFFVSWVYL
ncbi:hypothetical protein PInf_018822 [Phytophthora infestans]|nr:hypothetical protein PInf_018822 [Phytophthora infestans]